MIQTKTKETLYLLVTCTMEETRYDVLKKCVESVKSNFSKENIDKDFLVFDNNSSHSKNDKFLLENFSNIVKSKQNVGLWSAVNWVVENYKDIMKREYKNICLIESDLVFYDTSSLPIVEMFLNSNESSDVGCVRIKEYSVKDNHLFDKAKVNSSMKTYRSRCMHMNYVSKKAVTFQETSFKNIHISNFHSLICAINRIDFLRTILKNLATKEKFIESHFYEEAYKLRKKCGVVDKGCFFELSADINRKSPGSILIESSYTNVNKLRSLGYVETRLNNKITQAVEVERVHEN